MTKIYKERMAICAQLFYEFRVCEAHSFAHFVIRYMHNLDGFQHIVAEVFVELLFYVGDFLLRFFRERIDKIAVYDFTSVPYYIVDDRVYQVAEKI